MGSRGVGNWNAPIGLPSERLWVKGSKIPFECLLSLFCIRDRAKGDRSRDMNKTQSPRSFHHGGKLVARGSAVVIRRRTLESGGEAVSSVGTTNGEYRVDCEVGAEGGV